MIRKKEVKVETHDEWRDKTIKELTTEEFNIIAHDIRYVLSTLRDLEHNIDILRVLMSERYKDNLRKQFPNGDIDKINSHDLKRFCDKIEANLICLEPALNSVKQIERLPTAGKIVKMIENEKEIKL